MNNDSQMIIPSEENLEELIVLDSEFHSLEQALGGYCIFEAMNLSHKEVWLGNLLSDFLSPVGAHGYGSSILRTFLMEAVRNAGKAESSACDLTPLDVHLLSLESGIVRREWRRIDILIKFDDIKLVVAVELKLASQQSEKQLEGYRSTVEQEFPASQWRHVFVFLTVASEPPQDPAWIPLRYRQLVPALRSVGVHI